MDSHKCVWYASREEDQPLIAVKAARQLFSMTAAKWMTLGRECVKILRLDDVAKNFNFRQYFCPSQYYIEKEMPGKQRVPFAEVKMFIIILKYTKHP